MSQTIKQLMTALVQRNGSDLHLTGDSLPYFRVQGQIVPADSEIFQESELHTQLQELIGKEKLAIVRNDKELDCSYGLQGVARFRLNIFYDRGHISCVMRALSTDIPSFSFIGLPDLSLIHI